MIIAGTGHRPPRLGLSYSAEDARRLSVFAENHLSKLSPKKVISGMALGWDQAIAIAAIKMGLPLVCAIPFKGVGDNWPAASRATRDKILSAADEVVYTHPGNYRSAGNAAYAIRDQWMVDNAGLMVALWDGKREGGTWQTVVYAFEKRVSVLNLWEQWTVYL